MFDKFLRLINHNFLGINFIYASPVSLYFIAGTGSDPYATVSSTSEKDINDLPVDDTVSALI